MARGSRVIFLRASLTGMYQIKLSSIYTLERPVLDVPRLQLLLRKPEVKQLDSVFHLIIMQKYVSDDS